MKNLNYFNENGIPFALSNLQYRHSRTSPVTAVMDAAENASTAEEFRDYINDLNLIQRFTIDRVTNEYCRLVTVDPLGNKKYLKAEFSKATNKYTFTHDDVKIIIRALSIADEKIHDDLENDWIYDEDEVEELRNLATTVHNLWESTLIKFMKKEI